MCWPGYEDNVVNNPSKVLTLLEIMFEHVGVDEAMIGVQQPGRDNDWATTHISSSLWYDSDQAREHMEQRLAWRRLGGAWA